MSKYKNTLSARATLLVAAPWPAEEGFADFQLNSSLGAFIDNAGKIHLFYSVNDVVVPMDNMFKYATALGEMLDPGNVHVTLNSGHFIDQQCIPELLNVIVRESQ